MVLDLCEGVAPPTEKCLVVLLARGPVGSGTATGRIGVRDGGGCRHICGRLIAGRCRWAHLTGVARCLVIPMRDDGRELQVDVDDGGVGLRRIVGSACSVPADDRVGCLGGVLFAHVPSISPVGQPSSRTERRESPVL